MLVRLVLISFCLAVLTGCGSRGADPVVAVPVEAEPLDPAITPLVTEQETQIDR